MPADTSTKKDSLEYKRSDPSSTEVVLEVSIPGKALEAQYKKELQKIALTAKVKGFRPGKAPLDVVESSRGSEARSNALESVISEYAAEALKKEKLAPVMPPSVEVKEFSKDGGVTFNLKIPVIPEVKLPDFSSLKMKQEIAEVEDKEVEEVLKRMWQDNKGEHKDRDDAWVKIVSPKLGFKAQTIDTLKKELKEAIHREKERISKQSFAEEALREAVTLSKIEVPEALLEAEMSERERSFSATLNQMKTTEDEFCKSRGVTMEKLKEQWKKDSKDAVENDVFLAMYAKERDIKVIKEELEKEINVIRARAKDSSNKVFDNPEWRRYIERVALKRKAFTAFLQEIEKLQKSSSKKAEEKTATKKTEADKSKTKKSSKK